MDRNRFKKERRSKIRKRIRSTIRGTADRPRLAVYKSNKHVHLQLINDLDGKTLIGVSSSSEAYKSDLQGKSGIEQAKVLASGLAKTASDQGDRKSVV